MLMRAKSEYLEFLLGWLSPLGGVTARAMFGGYTLYCDGVVFALVAENTLYLKVDDEIRPRFESLGLKPFRPFEDRPEVMQYYPPPAEFFEDEDTMREWATVSVDAGRRAQATRNAKPRRGRASKPAKRARAH
jgi:DNA transformation protein and related proteins